ncbi:glycosyltransferase family 8 protein [Anianabacter salinae]|uniref:glycosyltransferase family 8 protein n=1 Tax=Anianabacter salinae TaxID=2851023 RepID=UPI00225E5D16|nr:glycosyltransferase [Anianabacter salinae]MBV0913040.1 glycosyltransferase [Anianabacter salinae]
MTVAGQGYALAMVVTSGFLPGALAALHSFHLHNPWFGGDVVVFGPGLTVSEVSALERVSPNLQVADPPPKLVRAIDRVVAAQPQVAATRDRFLSGAALTLAEYDTVLFLDADILVRGDLSAIYVHDAPLLACPDRALLIGKRRRAADYGWAEAGEAGTLACSFNAGVMLLNRATRGETRLGGYLDLLARYADGRFDTDLRDQALFNILFAEDIVHLPSRYNFLVSATFALRDMVGLAPQDAAIVHFNGPFKPWRPDQSLALAARHPELRPILREWADCYRAATARPEPVR